MNLASEWHQMVFAEAGNIDVTSQDHFDMVLCKDSIVGHVCVGRNYLSVFRGGNGCTRKKSVCACRGGSGINTVKRPEPACQTLLVCSLYRAHDDQGWAYRCGVRRRPSRSGVLGPMCAPAAADRIFSGRCAHFTVVYHTISLTIISYTNHHPHLHCFSDANPPNYHRQCPNMSD